MRNGAVKSLGFIGLASTLAFAAMLGGCQNERETRAKPLIQAPSRCVDVNFPIYFEPRSSAVTPEADRLIRAARSQSVNCEVTHIVVVGLADAPGAPDANMELAKRRADSVTRELRRRGFTTVEFREAAAGAAGASTATGAARPLRRRADVSIHLSNLGASPAR